MSYMYMHVLRVHALFLRVSCTHFSSLIFKTENTKTIPIGMKIRLRHKFDVSLAFLIQYFSFLPISYFLFCLQLSNQAFDQAMEYWKRVDFYYKTNQCSPNLKRHLFAQRQFNDQFDKFAVKLLNSEETVSHFPCEYSRIV